MTDGEPRATADRRTLLQSTGALAGGSFLGSVPAAGRTDRRVRLVEAALGYDVAPGAESRGLPVFHVNERREYRVDPERGTVAFDPQAEPVAAGADALPDGAFLVRGREWAIGRTELFGTPRSDLPVGLTADFTVTDRLRAEEPRREPAVTVAPDGGAATVAGPGIDERVRPGEAVRVEFDPVSVPVERRVVAGERVEDAAVPAARRPLRTDRERGTVELAPTLRVRNRGRLAARARRRGPP